MLKDILHVFREASDPALAAGMAAYMKDRFVFLGIKRPDRNVLQREFLSELKRQKSVNWEIVSKLYEQPEREYHYLALDYLKVMSRKLQPDDMHVLEEMIRIHSWWDSVDHLAGIIGALILRNPGLMSFPERWIHDPDKWIRRTAIIFQLKFGRETNVEFLEKAILANTGSKEFFINKAIGWSLRQYSKTDPVWVRQFIDRAELSGLSRREATKYL